MEEKRYYWLKVDRQFFESNAVKELRSMQYGDECVVIYLKLLLMAAEEGRLKDGVEELALELEEDATAVSITIRNLEKVGLLRPHSEGGYDLSQCEMVRSETAAAARKRKQRSQQKTETPQARKAPRKPAAENTTPPTAHRNSYTEAFETFWGVYPRRSEKQAAFEKYNARLKDGFDDATLLMAATAYRDECFRNRTEQKYIKLAKTFLSNKLPFTDYIADKKQMMAPSGSVATEDDPFGDWR